MFVVDFADAFVEGSNFSPESAGVFLELVGCNDEDDVDEGCASDEEVTEFFRTKDPRLYVIVGEQFVDFSNRD